MIAQEAYDDLFHLKDEIKDPNSTLIVAPHGLEWWVAWTTQAKIVEGNAIDPTVFDKYSTVLVVHQKKGMEQPQPGKAPAFAEPIPPATNRVVFYNSDYFVAYRWVKK